MGKTTLQKKLDKDNAILALLQKSERKLKKNGWTYGWGIKGESRCALGAVHEVAKLTPSAKDAKKRGMTLGEYLNEYNDYIEDILKTPIASAVAEELFRAMPKEPWQRRSRNTRRRRLYRVIDFNDGSGHGPTMKMFRDAIEHVKKRIAKREAALAAAPAVEIVSLKSGRKDEINKELADLLAR